MSLPALLETRTEGGIRASLNGAGLVANNIFDLANPGNRDNCYEPFVALQRRFLDHGILLQTADQDSAAPLVVELQLNASPLRGARIAYLLMMESSLIHPANRSQNGYADYRRVFTWDDSLVDGQKFVKLNFPNDLRIHRPDGWRDRDGFCCLIAGNKSVIVPDSRELYSARVEVIRWFEQHAPGDFGLYGVGWDLPPMRPGLLGRGLHRLLRQIPRAVWRPPFPSYRGPVEKKSEVLRRYRFSICYENVRDLPGYITEKLFDCFFAGCVPVYWGASNIERHVPPACFIDRRQFSDLDALYRHLKGMDEATYRGHQEAIAAFLASPAARPYSSEAFVDTIVSEVMRDLAGGQ